LSSVDYFFTIATFGAIYGVLALGFNLQWGFTGILNLGYVAFFGIGAYSTAILSTSGFHPVVGFVVGCLISTVLAICVGLPTIRLREDYLAMATLGLAQIIQLFDLNEDWLTQGPFGITGVPYIIPRGLVVDYFAAAYFAVAGLILLLAYFLVDLFMDSPWGRALRAIREDEYAATALGKNVFGFRLQALIIGSIFASMSGSLYAQYLSYVSPDMFGFIVSVTVTLAIVIGGIGNNIGVILGAFLIMFFTQGVRFIGPLLPIDPYRLGALNQVVLGLLFIIILRWRPQGLMPEKRKVTT